jgi:hypothetical protein
LVLCHRDFPRDETHFHDAAGCATARQAKSTASPVSFEIRERLVTRQQDFHPHDSVSDSSLDIGNNRAVATNDDKERA